jgi:hypothetical protein
MLTTRLMVGWLAALLLCGAVFSCGGGGREGWKDDRRKEYQRDPEGYKDRWGF